MRPLLWTPTAISIRTGYVYMQTLHSFGDSTRAKKNDDGRGDRNPYQRFRRWSGCLPRQQSSENSWNSPTSSRWTPVSTWISNCFHRFLTNSRLNLKLILGKLKFQRKSESTFLKMPLTCIIHPKLISSLTHLSMFPFAVMDTAVSIVMLLHQFLTGNVGTKLTWHIHTRRQNARI